MLRIKAVVLVAALSLGVVLSLVSATSGRVVPGRVGNASASRAPSSSLASSEAGQALARPQSSTAELQTVGGEITCAGLAGLATGLAIGALAGCGPLCLGLALGVVVVAAGC